jgi:hypothetical protein
MTITPLLPCHQQQPPPPPQQHQQKCFRMNVLQAPGHWPSGTN